MEKIMTGININYRTLFFLLLANCCWYSAYSQNLIYKDSLKSSLRGFSDENIIFRTENNNIFVTVGNNGISKEEYPNYGVFYFYANNDVAVFYNEIEDSLYFQNGINKVSVKLSRVYDFIETEDHLFFTCIVNENYFEQIGYFDFETNEIRVLPISGNAKFHKNGNLYFETDYLSDSYSTPPKDIFRLRVSKWQDFELVYESAAEEGWFFDDKLNSIHTGNYISHKKNNLFYVYNFEQKKYGITGIRPVKELVYLNDNFYNMEKSNLSNGQVLFEFKDLPSFGVLDFDKDSVNISKPERNKVLNVSYYRRSYNLNWLSDYLVYDAPLSELNKLSKKELRIVRNALFAKHGYVFESNDLADFFMQFKWYSKMVGYSKENYIYIQLDENELERLEVISLAESQK